MQEVIENAQINTENENKVKKVSSMSVPYSVKKLLNDPSLIGQPITVRGWVRTRRDSKAGISFVAISDGSCFDVIQAVVPNTLKNYESDVLKLTKDCSVEVIGELIQSEGKGQSVEIKAESLHVYGFVEDPETYPMSPKRHSVAHIPLNAQHCDA